MYSIQPLCSGCHYTIISFLLKGLCASFWVQDRCLLTHVFYSVDEFLSSDKLLFIFRRVLYLLISSCSSFILTTFFFLLHSYRLSVMFDPIFTLLSLQLILYIYIYIYTTLHWATYISWQVSYTSVDGQMLDQHVCMCTSLYSSIYIYIYIYIYILSCTEQPIFPDKFHILPSMDKCWISKMYVHVCMYVYIIVF